MIKLPYTAPEIEHLKSLLVTHHLVAVRIRLLDLNHTYIDDLSHMLVGGQVNYDASADITRSLDLNLFDPLRKAHLDDSSPLQGSVFMTHMISVMYSVIEPGTFTTYNIPVFCGPVDKVTRNDAFLNVKCLGKEILSIGNLWHGKNYKEKQEKTTVIRAILTNLSGESKLNIPNLSRKLPNDLHLKRDDAPWRAAKRLAGSMGYQLFYDGRGVAQMRKEPDEVCFTFKERALTSIPQIDYDLSKTINAFEVRGKKPKKSRDEVKGIAIAPQGSMISPRNLGRKKTDGTVIPRFLWAAIEDPSVRTDAEAKRVAKKKLARGMRAGVSVTFEAMHVPFLEENDTARLRWEGNPIEFPMKAWTLPLDVRSPASYGFLKRPRYSQGKTKARGK